MSYNKEEYLELSIQAMRVSKAIISGLQNKSLSQIPPNVKEQVEQLIE
jgi:hypothetical protein